MNGKKKQHYNVIFYSPTEDGKERCDILFINKSCTKFNALEGEGSNRILVVFLTKLHIFYFIHMTRAITWASFSSTSLIEVSLPCSFSKVAADQKATIGRQYI